MNVLNHLKNKSKLYLLATTTAFIVMGCKETKFEYSQPIQVVGTIAEKEHVKESYLNPIDDINPLKEIDPFFDFRKGRFLTKQDEEFNVYIKTKIMLFRVNNKNLFDKEIGSSVNITYREMYRNTYDDIDGDGKKDLVKAVLTGFDVLDVNPKKE